MRKVVVVGLASLATLFVVPSRALGASTGAGSTLTARQRVQREYDARHARMVARGLHPAPAVPVAANTASSRTLAFSTPTFVRRISEDTLPATGTSEPDTQIEPDIAMDPNNSQNVVAVFQQGRFPDGGSVDPGWATSHDGGHTWKTGNLPGLTTAVGGPYDRASDPAVAFGPDGAAYAVTLPFDNPTCPGGVGINRSDDGGLTWNNPVFLQRDTSCGVFDDKEWVAVDTFPASPFFGRVYVAWDRSTTSGQPIVLKYSDDRGQTWSSLITVSNAGAGTIGARPVVLPNGNLAMVYENFSINKQVSQTSTNGGSSFGASVSINSIQSSDPPDQRAGSDLPSAAVDPVTGDIYVVWGDTRFRSDGVNDAVISKSTDEGHTWSALSRANQDSLTDGISHLTPAVAADGGFVHVTYLTRAKVSGTYVNRLNERYIVSADGGQTFGGELVLGPNINLRWAAQAGGKLLGDYMGVAASADAAHAVWCRSSKPPIQEQYHQTAWSGTVA